MANNFTDIRNHMHLINTTFCVDRTINASFRQWLDKVYINAALSTPFLSQPMLTRVLGQEDPDADTYALHLKATTLEEARRWHDDTAALLRQDMTSRFGRKVLFFTTYLEILD